MPEKPNDSKEEWVDPDDAPELTDEWFDNALRSEPGETVEELVARFEARKKGGRPKSPNPKQSVHLRLDPDVIDHFKAGGPGWQTRINAALRDVAGLK